jgi:membrane protein
MSIQGARGYIGLAKDATIAWWADRAMSMGASIAFYAASSLAPMLLLVISISGLALGEEAARGAIVQEVGGLIGRDGAAALEQMVQSASDTGSGIVGTMVGIVTVLILSTGALVELQVSLNVVWRATPPPGRSGLLNFLRTRLLSFAMILTIGFLLLVSLAFDAAVGALGRMVSDLIGAAVLLAVLSFLLSLAIAFALVAFIFKFLPDADVAWRDVWFGALITSILLAVGKFAIGAYIGSAGLASTYGAAGSLIAVLLWVYYSSLILFLGTCLTAVTILRRDGKVTPKKTAVRTSMAMEEDAEPSATFGSSKSLNDVAPNDD